MKNDTCKASFLKSSPASKLRDPATYAKQSPEHALKNGFDFHLFDRVGGQLRFDHPADQKVLLLGHGFDSGPFGQQ